MTEHDFTVVSSKIDEEKEFLNSVSQEIWKMPELCYKEVKAHAVLTSALKKYGFSIEKHYFMSTAFRAEYSSKISGGPTIAILCEYDALPDIGHACGHNLIAEAGIAAAIGVKAVMETDPKLAGKLVVLGTPAEEGGGGKIRLIELGAFENVDAAMMVHPTRSTSASPPFLCIIRCFITYKGKEAHASAYPWEGNNALDAAVACYNNISMLRQQIKPTCRIHGIITKGGVAPNIIPAETQMQYYVRAPTVGELEDLKKRVEVCITSAAAATRCEVTYNFDESNSYQNVISNQKLASLFRAFGRRLGLEFLEDNPIPGRFPTSGSTDMGNVSHVVPSIHPFFGIPTDKSNHTPAFTQVSGSPEAQPPTLAAAKSIAMTTITLMRSSEILNEVKQLFEVDVQKDKEA